MARNAVVSLPEDTHTELTNANADNVTLVNNSADEPVLLTGTADDTTPTDLTGALVLAPGERLVNVALADLFPGITAARVFGYAHNPGASVFVSHADAA